MSKIKATSFLLFVFKYDLLYHTSRSTLLHVLEFLFQEFFLKKLLNLEILCVNKYGMNI